MLQNELILLSQISQKRMICMIYWYFLDKSYKYESEICEGCHDLSTIAFALENVAILNIIKC